MSNIDHSSVFAPFFRIDKKLTFLSESSIVATDYGIVRDLSLKFNTPLGVPHLFSSNGSNIIEISLTGGASFLEFSKDNSQAIIRPKQTTGISTIGVIVDYLSGKGAAGTGVDVSGNGGDLHVRAGDAGADGGAGQGNGGSLSLDGGLGLQTPTTPHLSIGTISTRTSVVNIGHSAIAAVNVFGFLNHSLGVWSFNSPTSGGLATGTTMSFGAGSSLGITATTSFSMVAGSTSNVQSTGNNQITSTTGSIDLVAGSWRIFTAAISLQDTVSISSTTGTTHSFANSQTFNKTVANTSGSLTSFLFTGAADTGLTASTEVIDFHVNLSQTKQHATGAITTQRSFLIQPPTHAFVAASTITTASTFAISGSPVAGTNATITFPVSLHVQNGAILSEGTTGGTPASGAGTRLMWVPEKAAFRAGKVSGTQWNDASVGIESVAFGRDTTASGANSFACGLQSTASGINSFAGGTSTASGNGSVSLGLSNSSSSTGTVALGNTAAAIGAGSVAIGNDLSGNGQFVYMLGKFLTNGNNSGVDFSNATIGVGVSTTDRLENTTSQCLMVGFNSTIATLFVGGGSGVGTIGKVGIGTSTPSSELHVNGSQTVKRTASAAGAYTVLVTDYYIGKTGITGGGDTVTLPAVATAAVGKVYIIKDESGTAGTNNITIDGNGAETIDGAATKVINTNFGSATLICSGAAWFII